MSNIGYNFKFPSDYSAIVGTTTAGLLAYTTDIQKPVGILPNQDSLYCVTGYNPSTVSDITVIAQNKHSLFGPASTDAWAELTRWTLEKTTSTSVGTIKDTLVQGLFLGSGISRLAMSNVTTGSSDINITGNFRITKV